MAATGTCEALTLRSLSLPPAEWMAPMRALCSDVSLGAGLWTTGLNFFFGPKMLGGDGPSASCVSVHNTLGFCSCSGTAWLLMPDALGEGGDSLWTGTHLEPFTRALSGAGSTPERGGGGLVLAGRRVGLDAELVPWWPVLCFPPKPQLCPRET